MHALDLRLLREFQPPLTHDSEGRGFVAYVREGLVQVETSIALSICAAALWNLLPTLPVRGHALAFGFGLLHGFGF
jgi:hypothetical protein